MRVFLVFVAIVALPVLVLAHRQYFLVAVQPRLAAAAAAALNDPAFAGVERRDLKIDYLDVSLEGWVADPALREEARRRVASVRGLRCLEEDNHLRVPTQISSQLAGEKLTLSGWLHDEALLREITGWLQECRPGLQVDAAGVRLSPYVPRIEPPLPGAAMVPPPLADVWESIRVNAGLKVARESAGLTVSGSLPGAALGDAVTSSLQEVTGTPVKVASLRAGSFVRAAAFANEEKLVPLLRSFFASPGASSFEAGPETVTLRGFATPERFETWKKLADPLSAEGPARLEFKLFAAPFLFPNYVPESRPPPDVAGPLLEALHSATIRFESGELNLQAEHVPKLDALAPVIVAAGPAVRIIVAAHLDTADDPALNEAAAKRRIDSVMDQLEAHGVPRKQMDRAVLPPCPAPDGSDQGRSIELVLK